MHHKWLLFLAALVHGAHFASPALPPSDPPSDPPSPPSAPPFLCPDVILKATGWQMISLHCAGTYIQFRTLNDIMKGVPFEADDQVLVRYPGEGLVFATYTGTKFVGNLVKRGLTYGKGYKVLYSGAADAVIPQTGYPGTANGYLAWPRLMKGWNYLGHATDVSYNLSSDLILRHGTSWSVDDRFRTRSLNTLLTANWDGAKFQGPLTALQPGVGYEVYVAEDVTFQYDVYGQSASIGSAPVLGGPGAAPGQWAGQRTPRPVFVNIPPARSSA